MVLTTFVLTEFSAWANHKYIMHGFMWFFHADHHKKDHKSWFERNDLFFIIYAVPSWLLIMFGMMNNAWYTWVGFGILLYGLAYFFVHDLIIHQRFKVFTKSNNVYVLALRRAHKMHHKNIGKEGGESFGMLIIKKKYLQAAMKQVKV
ncbi:carotene hydroxylase [Flavobacterium luteum]|uniref:Carotene hydroxylase n=1 Tax=Flavobacterium luteum TaxID=2026654 RepID=A0A7J5AE79_9FLAO|nr:carotene hydroxylase [Flavobacterium luteum]